MDWKKALSIIAGFAILAFLIANADIEKAAAVLEGINPGWFIAAVALNVFVISLKSLKWKLFIDRKEKIGFFEAIRYFIISFFFSTITPGRVGEFVRAKYVGKKTGLAYATTSVLLDRLIDVVMLLLIGFVAILVAAEIFGLEFFSPFLVLGMLLLIVIGAWVASKREVARFFLKPIYEAVLPESLRAKSKSAFTGIYDAMDIFKENKALLVKAMLLGVVIWVLTITMVYFLSLSIGFTLSYYVFFILVPIMALSDLIPLSVGGLGPREFITISTLAVFSVGYNEAIAFTILYFFSGYVLVALAGGVIYLWQKAFLKAEA